MCTDGAPAMVGKNLGFVGQLKQHNINVLSFHCIIHQEALAAKSIHLKDTMNTVTKCVNLIRGGHNSLTHRQFKSFLEEVDAHYSDLTMYTEVRWLSRGKCLDRFFELRKEVTMFLENSKKGEPYVSGLKTTAFLKSLAFLCDTTNLINMLNLKLPGKNKNVFELTGARRKFF